MTHHTDAERAELLQDAQAAGFGRIVDGVAGLPPAWWGQDISALEAFDKLRAARRAPAAPVPQCPFPCGWQNLHTLTVAEGAFLARSLNEDEPITAHQRDVVMRVVHYGIEMARTMLAAAPQPPEADHIPDAGKMDTNVRNWMNAALSKDVACPACGLSGLHACPSASTAESQGADAVKALEKVLRAVQRHLPPERIGERETIAEIISIVDPWPLAKPPANET